MEFRFYELPQGESALVLCGESWKRVYGHEECHLHFHNLLEIGICREGDGNMYLGEDIYQYHDGDIDVYKRQFQCRYVRHRKQLLHPLRNHNV